MTTILPKKKNAKFGPKSQLMTKHCMLKATNLRKSRKYYTNTVGDAGDILKVCFQFCILLFYFFSTVWCDKSSTLVEYIT